LVRDSRRVQSETAPALRCVSNIFSAANWNESFESHLARFDLVHVAPYPFFPRLDGANQRMLTFMEMFGCMLVLGRITTTNVPALQAEPKMDPRAFHFDAFFAHVLVCAGDPYLVEMCTCSGH